MEVLFVSHKHPPATGGMEKQSYELVKGMQQYARVHTLIYTGKGSKLFFFLTLGRKIRHICKKNPAISVVHFNDGLLAAVCLWHRSYSHLVRVITLHGLDVVFPNRIYQRYILPAFNTYDSIIAVSEATAEACIERGIDATKLSVIHNGVDHTLADFSSKYSRTDFFKERWGIDAAQKKIVLLLGRPVKRKGFSWFIEQVLPHLKGDVLVLVAGPFQPPTMSGIIMRLLPGRLRKSIELMMGWPSDAYALNRLLQDEVFARHVQHLGRLAFKDIQELWAHTDAFLVPNIEVEGDMEGFGLVCLEAALSGATVFAAASGGIKQAIRHGVNGLLLPAGDAVTWAGSLNAYFSKQPLVKEKLGNARSFTICQYGWGRMVYAYYSHFVELGFVQQKSFQRNQLIRIDQVNPALQ